MATFTVDQSATLAEFLAGQGAFQAWRVPLLAQYGAVTVSRAGRRVMPLAGSTKLVRDDVVAVADPLPARYLAALAALPASAFWDYAFVPGTGAYAGYARQFFTVKPRSKVIVGDGPIDYTLESFVAALGRSTDIDHAIAYPVVVSHANDEGQLRIAMNLLSTAKDIEYEDLEDAVTHHRLVLDPNLLQPRPLIGGTPAPAQLRVRGCRIGKALPFLRKLKEALGGGIRVNAPKHFQDYTAITSSGGALIGGCESMAYDFTVSRPSRVANTRALVQAFQRAGFTQTDAKSSPVAPDTWTKLMNLRGMPAIHKSGHHTLAYEAVARVPGQQYRLPRMAEYRYERDELFTGWGAFPLDPDPGTGRRRRAAVQNELSTQPLYQASHPYPMWTRMGFASMPAFMDGWTWSYRYDHGQLRYRAERSMYTFVVPITRPGTNELVMNFYGTGGNPVVEDLRADDAAYYATV